jgi:hypothetical protein
MNLTVIIIEIVAQRMTDWGPGRNAENFQGLGIRN